MFVLCLSHPGLTKCCVVDFYPEEGVRGYARTCDLQKSQSWAEFFLSLTGAAIWLWPMQAAFADQHFDQDFNFCAIEEDPVTKKVRSLEPPSAVFCRSVHLIDCWCHKIELILWFMRWLESSVCVSESNSCLTITHYRVFVWWWFLQAIKRILVNVKPRDVGILVHGSGTIDEDTKTLASFKDLLEKIFTLDPDKRLTVSQALSHSFISGKWCGHASLLALTYSFCLGFTVYFLDVVWSGTVVGK